MIHHWKALLLYFKNLQKKINAILFLLSWAFQKAKFYQNLTTESGSKERFSVLWEKVVIQAVCLRTQAVSIKAGFRLKGRVIDI